MLYARQILSSFFLLSFAILAACGGGGGGDVTPSNSAPTVSNVSITDINAGNVVVGDSLGGTYTYADADSDAEGASTFRWLRNGVAISGANSVNYTLVSADKGQSITFEVTPVAATGTATGNPVASNAIIAIAAIIKRPLNDTGIVSCADYAFKDTGTTHDVKGSGTHNNNLDCSVQVTVPTQTTDGFEVADTGGDIIRRGQDALFGRDVTDNDDTDGHAGFSFSKLDTDGIPLSDQSQDYATNPWACVKDNITGLVWEVKKTSGLQSNTYTYTWYNSTGINDGSDHGIGDTGAGTTTGYETKAGLQTGSDNCFDNARCDTEKYISDVNASNSGAGLCGATDWRLPSRHELLSIVNNNNTGAVPAIDTNYFPNVQALYYWTSSPSSKSQVDAWIVDFDFGFAHHTSFGFEGYYKHSLYYVRLVRDSM